MAYTPINWQTGDTITAEKLNRCDNGWAVESTQLFSETVTTTDQGGMYFAELAYSQLIDADTITVAYDGIEYTCPFIGPGEYGAPYSAGGFDFSEYPFNLYTTSDSPAVLSTQTAGTHAVAASKQGVVVSDNFSAAVNSAVDMPLLAAVIQCVPGVTTTNDTIGKLPFFYEPNSNHLHIITSVDVTCEILPESSTVSAHFGREDGLFYITTS